METADAPVHWHTLDRDEVRRRWEVPPGGLTEAEVERRRSRFGPNRLPETPPTGLATIVLRQFLSPLIYILVLAAIVSLAVGDLKDAGFIAAVLAINAIIGAYQEWKAERSSHALRKLLRIRATVVRDGRVRELPADEIVPGDLVRLESGNRVPADLRLVDARGLEVDESLLTGESLGVTKEADRIAAADASLGDRPNMAFAGSLVGRGRAEGIVVATGAATGVGQLAIDIQGAIGGKPPLLQRMERFTQVVAVATLAASAIIGTVAVVLGRYAPAEVFLFVVALAVSAIPEGLPVAMTVTLAIATTRMARRGVIVRRLTAVEGLGSCTLIATDKTGTLTVNELTVREVRLADGTTFEATGAGFDPTGELRPTLGMDAAVAGEDSLSAESLRRLAALARVGIVCNEAALRKGETGWEHRGDAVDVALLVLGVKLGQSRDRSLASLRVVAEIPFESERQYAATFVVEDEGDAEAEVLVKGAPERILAACASGTPRVETERAAAEMASRGLRVLALARGRVERAVIGTDRVPEPSDLELLGLVGMIDPLRPGVREAVQACRRAGVDVSMVTGDHRVTALAIARDLDLADDESETITGAELAEMSDQALQARVRDVRVFARVAPRQKLQIVQAARAAGHFVAVTGDGANDAPALRAANIGVAMGRAGTDVAREAAELVIGDDDFATIVSGIEEGRIAYDNIRKVIFLLLSTGGAELLMVLLTVLFGLPLPLLPVQLLWLNLVTNGIQGVALAFEPGEGDTLNRRPRPPRERIFDRLMIERMLVSVTVMGGLGFVVFERLIAAGCEESAARNVLLLLMVLFENFHIGNCRSETKSAFALAPWRSPMLLAGTAAAFLVHVAAMHLPPLQAVLGVEGLGVMTWGVVVAIALLIVPALELHKLLLARRPAGAVD